MTDEFVDDADLMCPNCVTPWKCNGPHLDDQTAAAKWTAKAVIVPDGDLTDMFTPTTPPNPATVAQKCRRHVWESIVPTGEPGIDTRIPLTQCASCGKARDEARRRTNRNNRQRGANFERTVAKQLGGRRTGPLGGRDDVIVGTTTAVQTKKDMSLSLNKARLYLTDLSRTFPDRTALVIHARPGRDAQPVVILSLSDWLALHGQDGMTDAA